MRKQIWITCIVIIAVCVALLLKTKHTHKIVISEQSEVATNLPKQMAQTPRAANHSYPNVPAASPTSPNSMAVHAITVAESNAIDPGLLARWQARIDFYGKVIDQNSNPVAGVNIHFSWSELPEKGGERTSDAESDADGLFSLNEKRGASLTVWYGKDGYYSSGRGEMSFSYALPKAISPDSLNPVVFHLHKKGTGENLIHMKQNYRVARDGTPLGISLTTGSAVTGGGGDLVVQCWTEDQGKRSGEKYNWHCIVTIPGGGVVPIDEEFAFLAPENGYAPTNEIAMPASRPDWQDDVDLKFYYHLADGRYGKMTFSMIAGGQHFCMIDSVLNPSGSRNLEPQ
jgi:hypothetical protein